MNYEDTSIFMSIRDIKNLRFVDDRGFWKVSTLIDGSWIFSGCIRKLKSDSKNNSTVNKKIFDRAKKKIFLSAN